jgi:hypothetical protein
MGTGGLGTRLKTGQDTSRQGQFPVGAPMCFPVGAPMWFPVVAYVFDFAQRLASDRGFGDECALGVPSCAHMHWAELCRPQPLHVILLQCMEGEGRGEG